MDNSNKMEFIKSNRCDLIIFLPILLIISLLFYAVQFKLRLSSDVAYLLYITKQLLNGGVYTRDIFETNPPMILYLYAPVYFLLKVTHGHIVTLIKNYIFFLSLCSLFACYLLLLKIFSRASKLIVYLLTLTISYLYLLMPAGQFGQREHLFFIFFLPYLFSSIALLEDISVSPFLSLIIGIFAGLGFALKPFFYIPFILIETYIVVNKKNFFPLLRLESSIIMMIAFLYLLSIILFQSNYIQIMLPILNHFYFLGIAKPLIEVISIPIVVFCFFVFLSFFFFYPIISNRFFSMIVFLGMIGMMIVFIIPRAPWFYHVYPALSLAFLLMVYFFIDLSFKVNGKIGLKIIFIFLSSVLVFFIPLYNNFYTLHYYLPYRATVAEKLAAFIKTYPNYFSLNCISADTTANCFPLIYEINRQYSGRFPFYWWLKGMLLLEDYPHELSLAKPLAYEKKYLLQQVIKDLNVKNTIVIIDKPHLKMTSHFDFIQYFSSNTTFQDIWKHYHLIKSIDGYRIYVND